MASSNAQRFLDTSSEEYALALKQFWGGVFEGFRDRNLLWEDSSGVISRKMVNSGKSHQFINYGNAFMEPDEHVGGDELLGQQFEVDEGTITVDSRLIRHYDIPTDQLAVSHFDVLAPAVRSLGQDLAHDFDIKLFRTAVLAARSTASTKNGLTIHNGGNATTRAGTLASAYPVSAAGAANFLADLAELGQYMDEDNVPNYPGSRRLYISPYIKRVLGQDTALFNRDFNASPGNERNRRVITVAEGFDIMEATNHLPSTNVTTGPASYRGDFTATGSTGQPAAVALCGQEGRSAIGFVQLEGIRPHMHIDERRNTVFMKAQMMVGADVLNPYCAGEIRVTG